MFRISIIAVLMSLSLQASVLRDAYKFEITEMTRSNHHPLAGYSTARKHIMQDIAMKSDDKGYYVLDVYCNEKNRDVSPRKMPNHSDINIEHTWPQSRFSSGVSKSQQKSDLHHLYPTNSRANSRRGNLKFSDFPDNVGPLRNCNISQSATIEESGKEGFEPPTNHKGNVARALFYFSLRYNIAMGEYEEATMRLWNVIDPVDSNEMRRNDIIEGIQGNRNPFIDDPSYADLILDF